MIRFGQYREMSVIPANEVVQSSANLIGILEENSMRAMDIPSDLIFRLELERSVGPRMPRWQLYPAKTLSGSSRPIRRAGRGL